jgi:hypothetical protein
VEYLGHIISSTGVSTDPTKINDVQAWPIPQNITDLGGFLRLAWYYRRFIKDYGKICQPLFDSLKKGDFSWGSDQLAAFESIKMALCSAPVLALSDFSKPFVLECDASGNAIGAVLMQEGKPFSFLSKSLGKKAAEMSTYDKEAIAIIEALKKWKHYLAEATGILRTDQQSLKFMGEQRLVQGIKHKLLIKLMGYNYKIEYKKGKENKAADALWRRPQIESINALSSAVPLWIHDVQPSYVDDVKWRELEKQLHIKPDSVPHFTLTNGLIRYKGRLYIGSKTDLRSNLIQSFHYSALGGHSGDRVTYNRIKSLFHWPGMKAEINTFIKNCPTCQKTKVEHVPYLGLLQPIPIPDMAWQLITMDFIEALPKFDAKDTILVVVDKLTKYAHFIPWATHLLLSTLFRSSLTMYSSFMGYH